MSLSELLTAAADALEAWAEQDPASKQRAVDRAVAAWLRDVAQDYDCLWESPSEHALTVARAVLGEHS